MKMMDKMTKLQYAKSGIRERINDIREHIPNCPFFELRKEANSLLKNLDYLEEIDKEIDKEAEKILKNAAKS